LQIAFGYPARTRPDKIRVLEEPVSILPCLCAIDAETQGDFVVEPLMITTTLGRLLAGENLSQQEMAETIDMVMRGHVTDEQIALLLTALRTKGETAEELAGAAISLRNHMTPIRTRHKMVIDTCGTGGVSSRFFNISTAAALVTAAAGVPVAKHGNRAITSRSGSADVLAALGVNIAADVACVERCLDELGICFCFAPLLHPSMKRVGEVRRRLGVPTIFNLLGPLCNPARAPFQLMGVGRGELCETMAHALALLGTQHSVVVCGDGQLGEVTTAGTTRVIEVITDGQLRELRWTAADFGLLPAESLEPLVVENSEASAAVIRRLLAGEVGPARDIVVSNAAAAMWVVGKVATLPAGAELAKHAIDSGAARKLLDRLVELTNQKQ
jgi:anthranilate phosphoribosyltransferase